MTKRCETLWHIWGFSCEGLWNGVRLLSVSLRRVDGKWNKPTNCFCKNSNQIKEASARAAQGAGTKFTCPHDSGEILMTIQLERKMSQRLPSNHAQADLGKGHQRKHLAPSWLAFPPLVKPELKTPRFHFGSSSCQNNNAFHSRVNKVSKENLNVGWYPEWQGHLVFGI